MSPGLLAHVAVSKYLDHWPLYRQGAVFERMGAVVHRSTMSQCMRKAGELVQPLVNLIGDELLGQPVLFQVGLAGVVIRQALDIIANVIDGQYRRIPPFIVLGVPAVAALLGALQG